MPTTIKCPKCATEFDIEDVLYSEVEQKIKSENQEILKSELQVVQAEKDKLNKEKQDFDEKKKKENELFAQKVQQEKEKMQLDIRKEVEKESGNKIKFLEEQTANADIKIKRLEEKELEALRLKNENDELKRNVENDKKKYLLENTPKIIKDALSKEKEQFDLEKKTLELKLDQQRRLIEEMERKVNQGSMQTQGEVQELLLEDLLKEYFPFDIIADVGKGVEGADCILIVKNNKGYECGKIIFESKRTKTWSNNWVDKLKHDMRSKQADFAILVSQVFPKGMDCFGEREGVWIASFKEVIGLTVALRNGIIHIAETKKSEENKGEKMQMLYNYLTGLEFRQQIEAVVEGFMSMKQSITRERIQMEKIWKEREKQLDKVLLNTSGFYGSIKGIAGASVQNIPLLENSVEEENEDDIAH
jgi:hypothetical protein